MHKTTNKSFKQANNRGLLVHSSHILANFKLPLNVALAISFTQNQWTPSIVRLCLTLKRYMTKNQIQVYIEEFLKESVRRAEQKGNTAAKT